MFWVETKGKVFKEVHPSRPWGWPAGSSAVDTVYVDTSKGWQSAWAVMPPLVWWDNCQTVLSFDWQEGVMISY
eukprot:8680051-Pyramimonas_sp.AAC.1